MLSAYFLALMSPSPFKPLDNDAEVVETTLAALSLDVCLDIHALYQATMTVYSLAQSQLVKLGCQLFRKLLLTVSFILLHPILSANMSDSTRKQSLACTCINQQALERSSFPS